MKLLSFLQKRLQLSSRAVKRVLESNGCRVNGRVERFGSIRLAEQDQVECITGVEDAASRSFELLYEDEVLKIVDKPAGWVSQEDALLGGYLVHRLDKETTGALLLAKTTSVRDQLMALFAARRVEKRYLALVDGIPATSSGTQVSFLAKRRHYQGQVIWGSAPVGKRAETQWQIVESGKTASLLRCTPFTGRTHQIRVHLAEMGHPILIDRQYAMTFRTSLFIRRPLLHAERLMFQHPMRPLFLDVSSPLPADFRTAVRECIGECQSIFV